MIQNASLNAYVPPVIILNSDFTITIQNMFSNFGRVTRA
jgi:hypothetical protein